MECLGGGTKSAIWVLVPLWNSNQVNKWFSSPILSVIPIPYVDRVHPCLKLSALILTIGIIVFYLDWAVHLCSDQFPHYKPTSSKAGLPWQVGTLSYLTRHGGLKGKGKLRTDLPLNGRHIMITTLFPWRVCNC